MAQADNPGFLSHFGVVQFEKGQYNRTAGTANWHVQPIPGFGLPIGPPLAQVKIVFDPPLDAADKIYTILLSAQRLATTPMLSANYGEADETGFVVHLFEPVSTRTLQNGSFSFAVLLQGSTANPKAAA